MHNVTYRFFEIRVTVLLKLWCHKHPYLKTFFSSVSIFFLCMCVYCFRQFVLVHIQYLAINLSITDFSFMCLQRRGSLELQCLRSFSFPTAGLKRMEI